MIYKACIITPSYLCWGDSVDIIFELCVLEGIRWTKGQRYRDSWRQVQDIPPSLERAVYSLWLRLPAVPRSRVLIRTIISPKSGACDRPARGQPFTFEGAFADDCRSEQPRKIEFYWTPSCKSVIAVWFVIDRRHDRYLWYAVWSMKVNVLIR